ncbi:unnamed protein product [Echinostoma caproni]|uniref:PMD domain-containing protein n=1 Tax=Echinostoma caproni TaxID=27848 RepID=A0A183AJ02_9TREM|nr:unnamed protein product [Echinostoma caproni]
MHSLCVTQSFWADSTNYGLRFNEAKLLSNLEYTNSSVVWLGMEIRNDLSIMIPEAPPPLFCQYSGLPLFASECLWRLYRSRPGYNIWRFAFRNMPVVYYQDAKQKRPFRFSGVESLNAYRLGIRLATLIWISIKTSPDRLRLLQPDISRCLAGIIKCKFHALLGPRQWRLHRLARNAFIKRLHLHRGELMHLFRALQIFSQPDKRRTDRFSLDPRPNTHESSADHSPAHATVTPILSDSSLATTSNSLAIVPFE